jgi:cytochrome P450
MSDHQLHGLGDLAVQNDPFAYYRERMGECPVWHETDLDLYVIGGLPEARAALTDPDTFSNGPSPHRQQSVNEPAVAFNRRLGERGWTKANTLQRTDPPVHTHYRKLINRVFTAGKVRELTPKIDAIVTELIDGFIDEGRCEFVEDFALPMPGLLIAGELGLDKSEYLTFRRWADAMLALAQRSMTVEEAIAEADVELEAQHFLAKEFEHRRQHPTGDLISMLVHSHGDEDEPLTINELQDLMHQLITGGFETTTGSLAKAMLLLIRYPDQREVLRERPELIKNFIEEALRFDSPVQGLWRHATCPVEVAGVAIPEGASVMVRYGAANHDERVFTNPDAFDITRDDARMHVAFGLGAHYCPGAALARQEMLSSFTQILARMDDFTLAEPLPELEHEPSYFLRPMKRLPITFTRR